MSHVLTIARNVFREAIRDRIMYTIALFALLCIGSTWFIADLSMRQVAKILVDIGLLVIALFGITITVFLGSSLLFREIDKGTIYLIISKPVSRPALVLGKWLGLTMTVGLMVSAMTLVYVGILALHHIVPPLAIILAVVLLILEVASIAAITLLFASFTSPLITTIATIIVVMVGHAMSAVRTVMHTPEATPLVEGFSYGISIVIPNYDLLNIRNQLAYHLPIHAGEILWGVVYIGGYTLVCLMIASWVFEKKDM